MPQRLEAFPSGSSAASANSEISGSLKRNKVELWGQNCPDSISLVNICCTMSCNASGFLPSRLCENTFISPEGVDYSPGRSPGFFGLLNRRNILAPAHTFERERSKVWAGAFYEDVCLCRVPRTASWAIFSVLHFVPDFLATSGHSAPFHTVSKAGIATPTASPCRGGRRTAFRRAVRALWRRGRPHPNC